ncbi:MAG: 6-phosphogluconolactonase [Sphingomonadaceae bacterium]|nr:6-phosphogluconolactonase [Sphingomonadaceae bacterium]
MTELAWAADGSDAAVAARVAAAVSRPGPVALCLPGGATPRPIFAHLAAMRLPWDKVTILPGDERQVPHDHPASNVGALRAAFGATGATIEPLSTAPPPPRFALTWLGMGADGHVASLFPNTDPNPAALPGVIAVTPDPLPPEAPFPRLTLTLAALAASDDIILVVRGAGKRDLLAAAARGENDLPVARLLRLAPVTAFWSAE